MDDFHVGSVPSSDLYGQRRPTDSVTRRRRQRHDEDQPDDAADTFELVEASNEEPRDASTESIEDYYLPSDPSGESE